MSWRILVVVDVQEDFVRGSLGFPKAEAVVPNIVQKVERALAEGWELMFTLDSHGAEYANSREGRHLPVLHCQEGSLGAQLVPELQVYLPEARAVFEKSNFGCLALLEYLWQEQATRGQSPSCIEVCGLVSDLCVLSNLLLVATACPQAELQLDMSCTATDADALAPFLPLLWHRLQLNVYDSCQGRAEQADIGSGQTEVQTSPSQAKSSPSQTETVSALSEKTSKACGQTAFSPHYLWIKPEGRREGGHANQH